MSATMCVGVVGLGRMGLGLAQSFGRALPHAIGTDNDALCRARAMALGVETVDSLGELARRCNVVVTVLPDGPDVEDVAQQLAGEATVGTLVLDASTIDPDTSRSVGAMLRAAHLRFADAAMAGSPDDAVAGRVLFLVGADRADLADVTAVLEPISRGVVHCGGVGSGVALKVVNNALALAVYLADVEALALATRAGIDPATTLAVLRQTVAANRPLDTLVPDLLERRLDGGFRVALARKDVGLAVAFARRLGTPCQAAQVAADHLNRAVDAGMGGAKVAAAGVLIERDAGIDLASTTRHEESP